MAEAADAALVLEAGRANGDIVSARKGNGVYGFTVFGRQAHAGVEPEKGANAIVELTRCIQELTALNGLHPGTTVNVGVIGGGTQGQRRARPRLGQGRCTFQHLAAGQVLDRAIRRVAVAPKLAGTRIEVTGGIEKGPMEKTRATAYLVELAQGVAGTLGFSFNDVQTGGTSDANHIGKLNIPVLDGLGPVGGDDHSPKEYMDSDSVVPRTALLAGLIEAIASHRDKLLALS